MNRISIMHSKQLPLINRDFDLVADILLQENIPRFIPYSYQPTERLVIS